MGNPTPPPTQDITGPSSKQPPNPTDEHQQTDLSPKNLPKGVVLGKDGKPCRTCTSFASWAALTKKTTTTTTSSTTSNAQHSSTAPPDDCPPDVNTLGRHTWTFLHALSANYPDQATAREQSEMRQFLTLFGKLYPCWVCADDFRDWMDRPDNRPRLQGRAEFGVWMCQAHNEVNRKLGKEEFDCARWEERWRTGWRDGRCG